MTTVLWIDWYSYHLSRFRALIACRRFEGAVSGIEMLGGCGVHSGMKFRDEARTGLPITSLFPAADWANISQLRLALAVWQKLRQLRPSAVLVPGYYTAPALAAALWAKLHSRRSILMTESTLQDHKRVWWKELAKRVLIRTLFDYSIAGGKPHVRYLRQLGFPQTRIARFYDVVDNDFYRLSCEKARRNSTLRPTLQLPDNYFLYVGRLASEKNVTGLIAAFAVYLSRGGTWSLLLVGDGPERKRLEQQCAQLGVTQSVHFVGFMSSAETIPYYAFADCFVLPSVREPWGLVVNEAMASGLPVIVSSRCGCAEDLVRDGENGFSFDPNQDGELTRRLLDVAAASPQQIESMRRCSQQVISGYSLEHWADEVARLVHQ